MSGKKINSGMRSTRSGMTLPSPSRKPGSLSLGPLPLVPPFLAEMLRLN